MTAFLNAIRRFWYPIAAIYMRAGEVQRRFDEFRHRGEIADAPEPYQPDLPRTKTCPINALPHYCCDPEPHPDDHHFEVWEKQFPKTAKTAKTRRIR